VQATDCLLGIPAARRAGLARDLVVVNIVGVAEWQQKRIPISLRFEGPGAMLAGTKKIIVAYLG